MKNSFKAILLIILALTVFSACSYEEAAEEETETQAQEEEATSEVSTIKEVETIQLGTYQPELNFSETGTTKAGKTVQITPEIGGRLVNIPVKEGELIKSGATLAILGDSLSTGTIDAQAQAANQNYQIALDSQNATDFSTEQQTDTAALQAQLAQNLYKDAVLNSYPNRDLFDQQLESVELSVESAEIGLEQAIQAERDLEDTLDDLEDDLDDIEDDLRDLSTSDPQYATLKAQENQLEAQIDAQEIQLDNAEFAVEQAQVSLERAENQLEQTKTSQQSQKLQLSQSIYTAFNQYQSAVNQLESSHASARLQELQAESQVVNAASSAKIARLQQDQKRIKAPITGFVTSITIDEGNLVNPGQTIIQIASQEALKIKTSVSAEKASLLKTGDLVKINANQETINGKITSISLSADEINKKVSVEVEITERTTLLPNAVVEIEFLPKAKGVFVPLNSVTIANGQKIVKIINPNSEVEYREVETGEIIGNLIEINSGLRGRENVITTVNTLIQEGDKVKAI